MPSHSRKESGARITARRSSPDWYNQFVQPQLETFQQQPVVRAAGLMSDVLGDPTDPANLAIGFMSPARRLAQAQKLRQELQDSQNIFKMYGVENKGVRSLQNAVKRYPHVMGHFSDVGMLPETSMPKAGGGQAGGYFQKIKRKSTKELNTARETSDPNYRMKLSSFYGPAGKGRNLPQSRIDNEITRHELGHAATALTDQPSALNYGKNDAKYGYRLNPDELRANAIEAKRAPRPLKNHGDLKIDTYESSYPKQDYWKRIHDEMLKGLTHAETKDVQRRAFARDFMNYEVDLPPAFYNYYFSDPRNKSMIESYLNIGRSSGVTPVRRTK
jgi:hypothetical protein